MNVTFLRGAPEYVGNHVNDFLERHGQGRPIDLGHHNGHITAVVNDKTGELYGVAYAVTAVDIIETLIVNGWGPQALQVANRFQSLEVLFVRPDQRGNGHGTNLLASISGHALRDFGAKNLLVKLHEEDTAARRWCSNHKFDVTEPGRMLILDDVAVPRSANHVNGWRDLRSPVAWVDYAPSA